MIKRSIVERAKELQCMTEEMLDATQARIGPIYGEAWRNLVKHTASVVSYTMLSGQDIDDPYLEESLCFAAECTILCGCLQVLDLLETKDLSAFSERMVNEFTEDVKAVVKCTALRISRQELEDLND